MTRRSANITRPHSVRHNTSLYDDPPSMQTPTSTSATAELVDVVMSTNDQPSVKRSRPVRTALFWAHLASGVVAGIVVLIMSLTGVLLAFERQLVEWDANKFIVLSPAYGVSARLPLDSLVARVESLPERYRVTGIVVRPQATAPVTLSLENRRSLFVDPYTARVLGDDADVRSFLNLVQRWHRSLATGPSTRDPLGVSITGASNLAFLFMILSGLVLWWPRQMSRRAFRAVSLFAPSAKARARDWNWHHVLGIWSAIPLFFIVLSATFMSYRWPQSLLESALGGANSKQSENRAAPRREGRNASATTRGAEGGRGGNGGAALLSAATRGASLDRVVESATAQAPEWRSIAVRSGREGSGASITVMIGANNRPSDRLQLALDKGGSVVAPNIGESISPAAKIRQWVRPVHTGEAFGLVGQTIAALVSAAAVLLGWTGLALVWRRFLKSLTKR